MTWTAPISLEPGEGSATWDGLPDGLGPEDVFGPAPEYVIRDEQHPGECRSDEGAPTPDRADESAFGEWARAIWNCVDRSRPYGVEDLLEGALRNGTDGERPSRVEDVGHLPTWRMFGCGYDDWIKNEIFIVLGRLGIYLLVRHFSRYEEAFSVQAAFLPLDRSPAIAVDIFEFHTGAQYWSAGLKEACQRVPSCENLLYGALKDCVSSNVDAAKARILGHDAGTPLVGGASVPVTELAPEALAVAMAKHWPTVRLAGRDEHDGHYGPWIGKVADGHLVRELSEWGAKFAFFSKQDTAYTDRSVLQATFDAHPDVEYTPLDADSHPNFHAQFTCEFSYMDEAEGAATQARLKALLPDGGVSIRKYW